MTSTTAPVPGDIVTARPWVNGTEAGQHKGLVCGVDGEYLLVWFYRRGPVGSDRPGDVQYVLAAKATRCGHVTTWGLNRITGLAEAVSAEGKSEFAALHEVLCSIARALAA